MGSFNHNCDIFPHCFHIQIQYSVKLNGALDIFFKNTLEHEHTFVIISLNL